MTPVVDAEKAVTVVRYEGFGSHRQPPVVIASSV
jgi:hypothetical protein